MRWKSAFLILLFGCLAVWAFAFGEGNAKKEDKPLLEQLESLRGEELYVYLNRQFVDRRSLEGELVARLDASKAKEVRLAATYLLGVQRMEGAVPHLSKMITLETDERRASREGLWGQYPVVDALIRIGNRAVSEMLRNIETSNDEKVRELSARVIRGVEGAEVGKFILERAMNAQGDEKKKGRLKAAMEEMK